MTADEVGFKLQPVEIHRHGPAEFAGNHPVCFGHALKLARGHVAALDDGARREYFLQRGDDLLLALLHAERGNLEREHVLVFVHDQAAEEIALGIHNPERCGVGQVFLTHDQGGADAFLEKVLVHFHPFGRKHADVDAGFGIVVAHAQQTLAMVFDLDHFAVAGLGGHAQDGAVIHPRMSRYDAVGLAGF